jgi:hypothetical protein
MQSWLQLSWRFPSVTLFFAKVGRGAGVLQAKGESVSHL